MGKQHEQINKRATGPNIWSESLHTLKQPNIIFFSNLTIIVITSIKKGSAVWKCVFIVTLHCVLEQHMIISKVLNTESWCYRDSFFLSRSKQHNSIKHANRKQMRRVSNKESNSYFGIGNMPVRVKGFVPPGLEERLFADQRILLHRSSAFPRFLSVPSPNTNANRV